MHAEIDDMLHQAKNSEEKAKKAMVDAARLADELRAEQDHTNGLSKAKRSMESQLGELENKFAEANENAMRNGRAAMAKSETRIRELEVELGNVQAHTSENARNLPSRLMKTRRTKIACLSSPPSFSKRSRLIRNRLRRLKKSL